MGWLTEDQYQLLITWSSGNLEVVIHHESSEGIPPTSASYIDPQSSLFYLFNLSILKNLLPNTESIFLVCGFPWEDWCTIWGWYIVPQRSSLVLALSWWWSWPGMALNLLSLSVTMRPNMGALYSYSQRTVVITTLKQYQRSNIQQGIVDGLIKLASHPKSIL